MKQVLKRSCWTAFVVALALIGHPTCGEELEIAFGNIAREPLIEVVFPPPGSPDRVRFTPEGMLIQQSPDVPGRPTGVTGVNMLLPAYGDFSIALDCKCLRLEEPSEGWGQGLLLQVFLDDEQQTVLKLARFAYPGRGQLCQAEITHKVGDQPAEYFYRQMEFKEGSLVISRTGQEVTFAVDNGSERQVIELCSCPSADVRTVEAGCTRLEKGNTAVEFLLRRLRIQADRFFSFQPPKESWFSWWKVLLGTQVVVVVGLLIVWCAAVDNDDSRAVAASDDMTMHLPTIRAVFLR